MRPGGLVFCVLLSCLPSASGHDVPVAAGARFAATWTIDGFSHDLWTAVLSNHVDSEGLMDYASVASHGRFSEYLYRLANTDPGKIGGSKARLALGFNAYNALVVQGVLETLSQDRGSWAEYSVLKVRVRCVSR